ncbi:MAG: tryptophanase [Deltaproteobacteria bacterium]|uniref:Tryptophanase n=1 Tax=Candidatus Zymogenus saltonus TaxID=2844893 RepID=A0A9D8PLY5_9DELT|nr:tryptophanase [Candidatus Zymogenus saltonus]
MISEPYKIKEVKKIGAKKPHERWNILKKVHFNVFHVSSDYITFDLVTRGMSSWSHYQKAGFMIGDEAYAGSRNYIHLERSAREVLGLTQIVPTHNGIGAEKLLVTTMLEKGQTVLHNRGRCEGLVPANGGVSINVTGAEAFSYPGPEKFGGNVDTGLLKKLLSEKGKEEIAYIHLETCPAALNGQPISLVNLKEVRELSASRSIPLAVDISHVLENAYWIGKAEGGKRGLMDIVREIIAHSDVVLMDASQDCRSDTGGLIASDDPGCFEKFKNQVVVYEGLHTYGGMTGRAMEVFAVGIEEMEDVKHVEWYASQIGFIYDILRKGGVPVYRGGNGIALDVERFLPHLSADDLPKFVLAASLYILGGLRGSIDGAWEYHARGEGRRVLNLELPRNAYTVNHLLKIADVISSAYGHREEISGLRLLNEPEFVDQAMLEPEHFRLFVSFPEEEDWREGLFEPYKIAIFEPLKITDRDYRVKAIEKAGYNTFLLNSEDVYIDLLTDSGTSAMSSFQWEGMTNSVDTPYSSRHYLDLVAEFSDILGFNYIIPTHQGRAAEQIMSQTMIRPGQIVPGNMYFTTTKLHQEMAGGVFVDVIVDEAHDPTSDYPWKGNVDIGKLEKEIDRVGPKNVAYISFEMSVNMAGGQPFSMGNLKELSHLCQRHGIPIMFDATRCVENAYMVKVRDPEYSEKPVREILREMLSYGDGCTISCKKDFLVNMGGILACNGKELADKFNKMLRVWEGNITNGGLDPKDMEALRRGLLDSLDDDYIRMRIEQTQEFGGRLIEAGVPIVLPPGSHAIFIDARRFLPHIDQDQYPAQALAAAVYVETGVRTMERGNVSKGRNSETGENYRPALELVRCTIPRRVYSNSHFDYVAEGIKRLFDKREQICGLKFIYEPKVLRFFQGRFEPVKS